MNKTNFMSICGQQSYFDGFCDRILSICVVPRGNFACVFARLVSPVCNMADNAIAEAEFKGMSCSTPVNPFKPGNAFTPQSDSCLDRSESYFGSSSCRSHSANEQLG